MRKRSEYRAKRLKKWAFLQSIFIAAEIQSVIAENR